MNLNLVTNKEQWDKQIGSQKMSQFLQSWEWGQFQQRLGRKIWRLDVNGYYVLVIKMPLPLDQNYLYAPRINFLMNKDTLDFSKELALAEKSIFLRLESGLSQELDLFGWQKTKNVQPGQTLMLDLTKSEAEILAGMHQKTRYNIRLAEKKGVKLVECQAEQFPIFYDLLLDTFRRKSKNLYNRNYYYQLYHDHLAKIFCAEYQGNILCANMVLFFGDTVTYLHGGSSQADKNIMAPHLLQWETIKKAKGLGYKYYDFWGIDEKKWPGVTRFKKGFGGFEVDYSGAWDLPLNKFLYLAYQITKRFK
ncbi:MAG: peptidoglycan bridge formation glycyltransferase FemA/FemB family protein [Candidatus Parcubacteria bacterium]|nr:peptidoglycan bridge formation glycyltransferase FemA/FemB family protein [Candidatus Parcubacteria bacterium]